MRDILNLMRWNSQDNSKKTFESQKEAEDYHKFAKKYFRREKLADYIAKTFQELIPPGSTIIDSAAGTGIVTKSLMAKNFEVISFDISPYQLDLLRHIIPGATTIIGDINSPISCRNESVNGITQVGANRFMTVEGQELFINRAFSLLKKEGIFIYPVFLGEIFSSKHKHGLKQKAFSFEISKFMEKCGFEILETSTLIHGVAGGATCTLIVAQKKSNPKQRSFGEMLKKSLNIKII
ncbi:MAG: class I SAM-dependent methyltransferase [Candidatus Pacebacteria bacterium]|nr:class I SAM-dependent methyltransferase [Candidatus Paceibacterota bacterium]